MRKVHEMNHNSMDKKKPLGMRIGESVFCVGYLTFAVIAAIYFFAHIGAGGASASYFMACAWMTLLLAAGDAFHLIPRVMLNIRPDPMKHMDHRAVFVSEHLSGQKNGNSL